MARGICIRSVLLILITAVAAIMVALPVRAEEIPQSLASDENQINEMVQQDLGEMVDYVDPALPVPSRLDRKPGFSKITVVNEMAPENELGLSDQMSTQPLESQSER